MVTGQTATTADFVATTTPLTPGATLGGFRATLVPPSGGGAIRLARSTSWQGVTLCSDTLTLQCTPARELCDSVVMQPGQSDCDFSTTFINRHLPAGGVDEVRLIVQTPGAAADPAGTPAGWMLSQQTGTVLAWRDTAGVLAPGAFQAGFNVSLRKATGNNSVLLQWCSLRNGVTICCFTRLVRCESTQPRCDSLIIRPTQDDCTYEIGFANLHSPVSSLDGLSVQVRTPGATIASVTTLPGWRIGGAAPQTQVLFTDSAGGVAPGGMISGFRVAFAPAPGSGTIRIDWCTSSVGRTVCCDSAVLECRAPQTSCDTLAVRPESMRPCCFTLTMANLHQPVGWLNGMRISVVEAGMSFFTSQFAAPAGWNPQGDARAVTWSTPSMGLSPQSSLGGFVVCLERVQQGLSDFHLAWETLADGARVCADTVAVSCNQTMDAPVSPPAPATTVLGDVFPNPAGTQASVRIDVPLPSAMRVDLYDAAGQRLRGVAARLFDAGAHTIRMDVSDLPRGTYFVVLRTAARTQWKAFTIVR
jgi:hypothetical protein